MWRRKKRIAAARALKLGAAVRSAPARRVSPLLSLAVRVSTLRAQIAWFGVAAAALTALYIVSKIDLHPKVPPAEPSHYVVPPLDLRPVHGGLPESYGADAADVDVLPGTLLIVALLLSWQRRKRRLMRYGREALGETRAADAGGDARAISVELAIPIEGTDQTISIVTVRSPDRVGESEPVLYDAHRPDLAIALADLPGSPRLVDGKLVPTSLPVLYFLLPLTGLALVATTVVATITKLR
jgi:hypothetical protein